MCGILGIAAVVGERPSLDDAGVARLRDTMSHRGPDDRGVWRHQSVVLAHRRLSVVDPSPEGRQPMVLGDDGLLLRGTSEQSAGARFALVYNGEIYNERQVRADLERRGARFSTGCDSETVLRAWAQWGTEALDRLRGMFALAIYDARARTLTLARDALGVKPLYFWVGPREIVFASEIRAIAAHPHVVCAPNPRMVSAYLTTIRTTLGNQTLFQGIDTLRPGQMMQCDLAPRGDGPPLVRLVDWWRGARVLDADPDPQRAVERVREVVSDSVRAQLRADVPVCALLSGGLDSTIIAQVAGRERADLRTFAAGCPVPGSCDAGAGDLEMAARTAAALGTKHEQAHVSREQFLDRWAWMIHQGQVPVSTPNEIAIYEVARLLRERGCVVTLSGEGADELFGGYEGPLEQAAAYVAEERPALSPGRFHLRAGAWVPPDFKHGVLCDRAWAAAEEDRWLEQTYEDEFSRAAAECGDDGLAAHLRFHRRINLTGLLLRLDSATMLAGVEGRTPFADAKVAMEAEALPMWLRFEASGAEGASGASAFETGGSRGRVAASWRRTAQRSKIVLREAFAADVPAWVVERPKASFPLPFEGWIQEGVGVLRRGALAGEVFSAPAINAVTEHPRELWHLAWPMLNIAMWGEAMGW